jgi:hypothetical protein
LEIRFALEIRAVFPNGEIILERLGDTAPPATPRKTRGTAA